jgi:hypothetical protein
MRSMYDACYACCAAVTDAGSISSDHARLFCRYKVHCILGSINSSGILLASNNNSMRRVVIKVYSSNARYEAEREAYTAVASTDHMFFPEIFEYSAGDEKTPPSMIMEHGEVGLRARMEDRTRAGMMLAEKRIVLGQVRMWKHDVMGA